MPKQKLISVADLDRLLAKRAVTSRTIWLLAIVAAHHAKNG